MTELAERPYKDLVGPLIGFDGRPISEYGKTWGGDFDADCQKLTSLKGAPIETNGHFSCRNNYLTSLKGAPIETNGHFSCRNNYLTSLEGVPRRVNGALCFTANLITSLSGIDLLVDYVGSRSGIWCDDCTHVLGLCLIPKLISVNHANQQVSNILNRHLARGRSGMVDAYDELMEAGLEKYAQL